MGDLVKSGAGGLMGLLHGSNGELTIPKPFEKDIFLLILMWQELHILRVSKN